MYVTNEDFLEGNRGFVKTWLPLKKLELVVSRLVPLLVIRLVLLVFVRLLLLIVSINEASASTKCAHAHLSDPAAAAETLSVGHGDADHMAGAGTSATATRSLSWADIVASEHNERDVSHGSEKEGNPVPLPNCSWVVVLCGRT